VRTVTHVDTVTHEAAHLFPSFLPDGKHFVYTVVNRDTLYQFRIRVGSLEGGAGHDLMTTKRCRACLIRRQRFFTFTTTFSLLRGSMPGALA